MGKLVETGKLGEVERSATEVGNVGGGWRKKLAGVWKSVTAPWVGDGLRGVGDGAAVETKFGVKGCSGLDGVNPEMEGFDVGLEADEKVSCWF